MQWCSCAVAPSFWIWIGVGVNRDFFKAPKADEYSPPPFPLVLGGISPFLLHFTPVFPTVPPEHQGKGRHIKCPWKLLGYLHQSGRQGGEKAGSRGTWPPLQCILLPLHLFLGNPGSVPAPGYYFPEEHMVTWSGFYCNATLELCFMVSFQDPWTKSTLRWSTFQ